MLLGLEPGYPGQDDRLDRSILAAILAILGAGMSFLLAMLFLIFPDWISPREFAIGVRTFVASMEVLSAPVVSDRAWAVNGPIQQAQTAFTVGHLSDSSDENLIQASRVAADKTAKGRAQPQEALVHDATSAALDVQRTDRIEREADPVSSGNSYAGPSEPSNASPTANASPPGNGYGSGKNSPSEKGMGKGYSPGRNP